MENSLQAFTLELAKSLEATMSVNPIQRKAAEEYINLAQKQLGYMVALLSISGAKDINPNIAVAAAVQLGTLVEHHWKFKDETHAQSIAVTGFNFVIFNEQDKQTLR